MSRLGPQWDTSHYANSVRLGLEMVRQCGLTPQRLRELFPPQPETVRVVAERNSLADKYREAQREHRRQGYVSERAD